MKLGIQSIAERRQTEYSAIHPMGEMMMKYYKSDFSKFLISKADFNPQILAYTESSRRTEPTSNYDF